MEDKLSPSPADQAWRAPSHWGSEWVLSSEWGHWSEVLHRARPWIKSHQSSAAGLRVRPPQQLSCATEMDEDVEFSPLPAEIWGRVTSRFCQVERLIGLGQVLIKETPQVPNPLGGFGKCPIWEILNIAFKCLLEMISPVCGWCSIRTFTNLPTPENLWGTFAFPSVLEFWWPSCGQSHCATVPLVWGRTAVGWAFWTSRWLVNLPRDWNEKDKYSIDDPRVCKSIGTVEHCVYCNLKVFSHGHFHIPIKQWRARGRLSYQWRHTRLSMQLTQHCPRNKWFLHVTSLNTGQWFRSFIWFRLKIGYLMIPSNPVVNHLLFHLFSFVFYEYTVYCLYSISIPPQFQRHP